MDKEHHYSSRVIFINNPLGRRQLKEALGSLLIGVIVSPEDIWLVSPWVSDFELLDNRSGNWTAIEPAWEMRHIRFSELLIRALESGSKLRLVTNDDQSNSAFIQRLRISIPDEESFKHIISDKLHIKGILTTKFFLAGSMNFTYSGANLNEEQVQLSVDPGTISEARIEFEKNYV